MILLQSIPALFKLAVVFVFIIVLIRKKISLGNTFLLGAIALGILYGMRPTVMIKSIAMAVIDPKTLSLSIIVSLILVLSSSMDKAGQMKRLLIRFKGLVKNPRLNIIIFPALIGLLPMPGGAVFSAPMVKELGPSNIYSPQRLSFINYWFRHIWEYWWPMYPGVLLITVLANISLPDLMLHMWPMTIIALFIGNFLLDKSKETRKDGDEKKRPEILPFIKEIIPIVIVVVFGLSLGFVFSHLDPEFMVAKESGLILSLFMAIEWVWSTNKMSLKSIKQILINPQTLKMIYMIFAIIIFKSMLEDSRAVSAITSELTMLKIPLILIVALLPFLVGVITGITIAFVGATFPILIPIIGAMDPGAHPLSYIMLAMVCGFSGVLVSPVHLCLILSNEYFETTMGSVYKHLWLPCTAVMGFGFIYFFLNRILMA